MYVYVGLNHEASRVDGEPLWSGVLVVPKGCIRCKKNMPLSFELDNRTICPALNVRIELNVGSPTPSDRKPSSRLDGLPYRPKY